MPRDHRKLEAFGIADELAVLTYHATTSFPAEERFGLRSQLRRSAVSVAANLVEGSARESQRDYLRFVEIAFASARELTYLAGLSSRLGYIDGTSAAKLDELGRRVQAALAGLRRSLEERPKTLGP
jgi:four helix bundle protein